MVISDLPPKKYKLGLVWELYSDRSLKMNKGLKVVKRLLFSSREQDGVRRADVRGQ